MSFCISGRKKDGFCRHLDRVGDNRLQDNRLIDICWRKKRVYSRRLTIFARYCGNRKKIKYITPLWNIISEKSKKMAAEVGG